MIKCQDCYLTEILYLVTYVSLSQDCYLTEILYLVTYVSLSTIVLNSRDWSEIVWLPEISCFKINFAISFIRKNPLECIG